MKLIRTLLLLLAILKSAPSALFADQPNAARPITWTDYGCRPNDPKFDNGPVLSQMIAEEANRKLKIAPVGELADYYVKTTIQWPSSVGVAFEGSGGYTYAYSIPTIGVTRIVWNGAKDGTVLDYRGSGGRIAKLQICGGPLDDNSYTTVAANGIVVEGISEPPSGNLVTEQLSIVQCKNGLHYLNTPSDDHADLQKHFGLLFHHVAFPYVVEGDQSCPHWLYGVDIREGYQQAFTFNRGGALAVYGCYLGGSTGAELLHIGRSNDHVGCYEIHGLQVDGAVQNLALLSHGEFAFRVRIDGNVGFASQLADPFVVMREGPTKFADVKIDCRNAQYTSRQQ